MLIGEGITFDLRKDAERLRLKSVVFDVAGLLLRDKFPDQVWRYPELVRITECWFDEYLTTLGELAEFGDFMLANASSSDPRPWPWLSLTSRSSD